MRQFVIVAHDAPTTPDFSLDDLPGAGRLDLLARCVTSSLLLSHGIRANVRTHLVLGDEFTISFEGNSISRLNPDERSTGARIRNALEQREEAVGRMAVETSPGISLMRVGFDGLLESVADDGTLCLLHEDGEPVVEAEVPADPIFVLSDHNDFTDEEFTVLEEYTPARVTLGPERLHADQAVTVAHNWLDTDGFGNYGGVE